MSVLDPSRQPVVVGVADLRNNRERLVEHAREPLELIADATRAAAADSAVPDLLHALDAIDVVNIISWAYDDPGGDLAARIGATPRRTSHSTPGGNRPVELLDRAAGRIAAGDSEVALVCGGEAMASMVACLKAGQPPAWSARPGGPARPDLEDLFTPLMLRYGIEQPIVAYPLYENALRAHLGQAFAQSQSWSAQMYAAFSRIAAHNRAAWDPVERTPDEIATPAGRNRMINHPYPLLMNAQLMVDQAAAILVASRRVAEAAGVAPDQMVYVWGGAGRADSRDLLERTSYFRSPAMEAAFSATFEQTGADTDAIDVYDLYSCFPVVPKLAALALGLPPGASLTTTGGLTSFGGPANNYSTHAVVAAVRALRQGSELALVYGNGELVTKHSAIVLGREAPEAGWRGDPDVRPVAADVPVVREDVRGDAVIETYTVGYARSGELERGYVIGRNADGVRFPSHATDPATLRALVDPQHEAIGRAGIAGDGPDGTTSFVLTH